MTEKSDTSEAKFDFFFLPTKDYFENILFSKIVFLKYAKHKKIICVLIYTSIISIMVLFLCCFYWISRRYVSLLDAPNKVKYILCGALCTSVPYLHNKYELLYCPDKQKFFNEHCPKIWADWNEQLAQNKGSAKDAVFRLQYQIASLTLSQTHKINSCYIYYYIYVLTRI